MICEESAIYRQSSAYTVLQQHGFLNNTVYFGTLICPFSTKLLLRLHGFLLTQLFFQSLEKLCKQRTPCICKFAFPRTTRILVVLLAISDKIMQAFHLFQKNSKESQFN